MLNPCKSIIITIDILQQYYLIYIFPETLFHWNSTVLEMRERKRCTMSSWIDEFSQIVIIGQIVIISQIVIII